ncbi:MAG: 50S ribosomal protein L24 [bacterium]|nr:50S ribosomal protein L24 [bacterium]
MNIHKGDNVQIMAGKDRGKRGKVLDIEMKKSKILIQGLNLFKKHKKPTKQGEKGETISVSRYLSVSSALLVCSSCDKPSRIGYKDEGGKKVRYCKKCQAII